MPFRELGVLIVVGAPIAYAAAAVAALLGWPLLRVKGILGALLVTLAGAVAGTATAILLRPHLGGDPFRVEFPPAQGAVLGAASAVVFWLIWTPRRPRPR
jgi:hypothetical protein